MATQNTPYIERSPGDLVTSEDWNEVQVKIKDDISSQAGKVEKALEEHAGEPVDAAKFGGKAPAEWAEQFAPRVHDHEGMAAYRRYFKRLKIEQPALLEHKLGRFPLVDIYQLMPIPVTAAQEVGKPAATPTFVKFFLYYGHEDLEALLPKAMNEYPELIREWGVPLEQILQEYEVVWEDDDSLGDVFNDFLSAFFKPPLVDHMEHKTSPWIDGHREKTVSELKQRDEWPDIRWGFIPVRLTVGSEGFRVECPSNAGTTTVPCKIAPAVNVYHLNYDKLAIIPGDLGDENVPGGKTPVPRRSIDLMILLRS